MIRSKVPFPSNHPMCKKNREREISLKCPLASTCRYLSRGFGNWSSLAITRSKTLLNYIVYLLSSSRAFNFWVWSNNPTWDCFPWSAPSPFLYFCIGFHLLWDFLGHIFQEALPHMAISSWFGNWTFSICTFGSGFSAEADLVTWGNLQYALCPLNFFVFVL